MIRNFILILILLNTCFHSFSEETFSKLNTLKIESGSAFISYQNLFDRGYTGHEHLTKFGLINMNGRTYDPWLGRMLQPDNYVQAAGYLQNYNRYSYVLNNPLIYTDPTGEKWWHWALADVLTGGLLSSTITMTTLTTYSAAVPTITTLQATAMAIDYTSSYLISFDDPEEAGKRFNNSIKIDAGLILHIPGWGTDQALAGNGISHYRNFSGDVDNVEINRGTVLVNKKSNSNDHWGLTMGQYINSENIEIGSDIYNHKYGHTIQSRILGPYYTSKIAIPSGLSAYYSYNMNNDDTYNGEYHSKSWYEVWANNLSGVPESKDYIREYRYNGFNYWISIIGLPFFPN